MKQIEDNLLAIFNAMIKNKEDWQYVTDEQKESYFFIMNRYFSKKYPELSQLFNVKSINKVAAMDVWHEFMLDKPYPKWFWSKDVKNNHKNSNEIKISDKDYQSLLLNLQIKDIDLDYLIINNKDFIKEELDYINKKEKKTK